VGFRRLEQGGLSLDVIRLLLGFAVDSFSTHFGELGEGDMKIMIDFKRLPRRVLTAGRTFRDDVALDQVRDMIEERLSRHVFDHLRRQAPEEAGAWRFAFGSDLPSLLPLRRGESVDWVTLEEATASHDRLILVPLVVAWRGPWPLSVPCLGITGTSAFATDKDENNLANCVLIEVKDMCTGILWPPEASHDGLKLFARLASGLPDGFAMFKKQRPPIRLKDVDRYADSSTELEDTGIAAYDRRQNPWEGLGFSDTTLEKKERHWKAVSQIEKVLREVEEIDYPHDLLHLTVPDGDSWE
jgi:hypothetical protein